MKLKEALQTIEDHDPAQEDPIPILLACGFEPLHLASYLEAHLCQRYPQRPVDLRTGLYGDLQGTLQEAPSQGFEGVALVIEWSDLDPRLGVRRLGGWSPEDLNDIDQQVENALTSLYSAIKTQADHSPVVVVTPSLPIPPIDHTHTWHDGPFNAAIEEEVAGFRRAVSDLAGVRLLSRQYLARHSPLHRRFSVKSALAYGFPYTLPHANILARSLVRSLFPHKRKKGLITDLDNTFWRGILGEDGPEGISWSLSDGGQIHALYQQFLGSLVDAGIFVGVASKNDPALVKTVFDERDFHIDADKLYPMEVHWAPKSQSVADILETWNISSDSVVFVDDSPAELAEVQSVYEDIRCERFPMDDNEEAFELLRTLRNHFGADSLSQSDRIRVSSMKQTNKYRSIEKRGDGKLDDFLHDVEGHVTVEEVVPPGQRAFSLVNKTNQFNLNSTRLTEADWHRLIKDPETFVWEVSYQDKFGPLGKIAVLAGELNHEHPLVLHWAMSCRAFSRRIEHHCLELMFERLEVDQIAVKLTRTERNGPARDFLSEVLRRGQDEDLRSGTHIVRAGDFAEVKPVLCHEVECDIRGRESAIGRS